MFSSLLSEVPELVPNDELTQFLWWDPDGEPIESMSPLGAEIARRCRFFI